MLRSAIELGIWAISHLSDLLGREYREIGHGPNPIHLTWSPHRDILNADNRLWAKVVCCPDAQTAKGKPVTED
jgi:hypothetical protein